MNKIIIKQYERILEHIIDKALSKLSSNSIFDMDVFFALSPERRIDILKNYMSSTEFNFIISTYNKYPDLRQHIDWLSS